jgi:hypothetical protein
VARWKDLGVKSLKGLVAGFCFLALSACTFVPAEEGLRPRTAEENNAITDSWYPIQSEECQLLVDSFGLVTAAVGNVESQYLLENMDQIKSNLEMTGLMVTPKLFELSQTTLEPSIKAYALEAIPLFSQLGDLIGDESGESSIQIDYLQRLSNLTGKVPDACKS